jgi:thiamine-monophosphate kinase
MDVSDGLLGDALKLGRASSGPQDACAPIIDLARLPLSDAACEALALDPQLISAIATGGDDYEVLMAVQPEDVAAVTTAGSAAGLAITDIGELVHGTEARFVGRDGAPARFGRLKYEHSWGA